MLELHGTEKPHGSLITQEFCALIPEFTSLNPISRDYQIYTGKIVDKCENIRTSPTLSSAIVVTFLFHHDIDLGNTKSEATHPKTTYSGSSKEICNSTQF